MQVADATLEETRAFNAELERLTATQPSIHTLPPDVTRQARREGRGVFPAPVYLDQARDITVAGRGAPVRLRVLRPEGAVTGAYLHMHGGGWTLGGADMQDALLLALAEATGLVVVSVDYRLAPEHPYPAGPDDCEDAALWLLEQGAAELRCPPRFAAGGESAGAQLATVTLLRLRDRHGVAGAFRAANLTYGFYDPTLTPSARLWGERNLVLSAPVLHWFADCFLPGMDAEARHAPDVSPLYADLRGMPQGLFTVGTQDALLDDTLFMEARWRAGGATAHLRVWPEACHGFNAFPIAVASAANAEQAAFLRDAVA